jgi:hypothetical protein
VLGLDDVDDVGVLGVGCHDHADTQAGPKQTVSLSRPAG